MTFLGSIRSYSIAVALAFAPTMVHASTIFSDNFDTNLGQSTISSGAIDTSATGTFTVTFGNVDVVGPNFFPGLCATPPETGSCVDLDGTTAGQITSSLIVLAPGTYALSFDLFGTERFVPASTTVTFGSFYNQTFNTAPNDQNIVTAVFTVLAGTSASIVFTSNDAAGSPNGTLIDNVSLATTTLPEPSSMILVGSALLGLGSLARRRLVRL